MINTKLLLLFIGFTLLSCNTAIDLDKYLQSDNKFIVSYYLGVKNELRTKLYSVNKDSEISKEIIEVMTNNREDWEKSFASFAGTPLLMIKKDSLVFKYYIDQQFAVLSIKDESNNQGQFVKNIDVTEFEKLLELLDISSLKELSIEQEEDTSYVNPLDENDNKNIGFEHPIISVPCYTSSSLKKQLKEGQLSDKAFNALSAKEHFIHSLYHPEWYRQSCSIFPIPENFYQSIPAKFKMIGEGYVMSTRQREVMLEHKDSICILLKDCIRKQNKVNDNFKRIITFQKFYELIPTLISTIENQDKKDPYILTSLCLMMKHDFKPFQESEVFKALYEDSIKETDFRSMSMHTIPFTIKNYQKIIKLSKEFYLDKCDSAERFVTIPKANYSLGKRRHHTNPSRVVSLNAFTISRYEITNLEFSKFINATNYQTSAELKKNAFVFEPGLDEFEWKQDSTANWRFPNGKTKGSIENKMDHPVTCISYLDAQAYCKWANVRLPSIEEWEVASRGNSKNRKHFFGDSAMEIYNYANIWQGKNHLTVSANEDFITSSPVGTFKPNDIGLFDIYGNVFEFCSNKPEAFNSYPNVAATRGGSWWCSMNSCQFFNSIDIGRVKQSASFSNNGFRVVLF